ncbi:MAG: DUF503 domain-containing protein [Andreesenia angusta]|nr:DUF503 domain-containing protein [Andreesenia angusta]
MFVGIAKIKIYIGDSYSLKDKRKIRYKIVERLKNKYNISIMEVEDQDIHRSLILGISFTHLTESLSEKLIQNIVNFIEEKLGIEIMDIYYEIIKFE